MCELNEFRYSLTVQSSIWTDLQKWKILIIPELIEEQPGRMADWLTHGWRGEHLSEAAGIQENARVRLLSSDENTRSGGGHRFY